MAEEQLNFFEVSCSYNNGYPAILEVLRPVKKIRGKWVEVKKNDKKVNIKRKK